MPRELTQGDQAEAWRLFNVVNGTMQIAKSAGGTFQADKRNAEATFSTAEDRAKANYDKAVATAQDKLDEAISEAKIALDNADGAVTTARQELSDYQAHMKEEVGYEIQLPVAVSGGRTSL